MESISRGVILPTVMGFQAKMGTEMAIARTVQALKEGQRFPNYRYARTHAQFTFTYSTPGFVAP